LVLVLILPQLRELVLTAKRTGLNSTASASASQLPAPASPQQQQQEEQQQQQQTAKQEDSEVQAAARAALTGSGPEVPGSNPAADTTTDPKTGSPQRPSTAPSAVRLPSGGGSSGGSAAAGGGSGTAAGRYSSLSCDPAQDWELQAGRPCGGEALLLMFDRWQKLAKTFYKKGKFDISKVGES
jgi:hypothetical protein